MNLFLILRRAKIGKQAPAIDVTECLASEMGGDSLPRREPARITKIEETLAPIWPLKPLPIWQSGMIANN